MSFFLLGLCAVGTNLLSLWALRRLPDLGSQQPDSAIVADAEVEVDRLSSAVIDLHRRLVNERGARESLWDLLQEHRGLANAQQALLVSFACQVTDVLARSPHQDPRVQDKLTGTADAVYEVAVCNGSLPPDPPKPTGALPSLPYGVLKGRISP